MGYLFDSIFQQTQFINDDSDAPLDWAERVEKYLIYVNLLYLWRCDLETGEY